MLRKSLVFGLFIIIFSLVSCSGKNYEIQQKPTVTFKTTMGSFKIAFYKKAAPKAVDFFIAFCKEGRYKDTLIDSVIFPNSLINIGFNGKVIKSVDANFSKEVAEKDKKIEKNEILFRSDSEGFGMFSIYYNPAASENEGKNVIFGKVIEGEDTLSKMFEVRVDSEFKPVEEIKILDVTVSD